MKKLLLVLINAALLTSCSGWFFQPSGYNPPTPFLPPTRTPSIVTATPSVMGASTSTPIVATATAVMNTPPAFQTETSVVLPTDTLPAEPTTFVPVSAVGITVLGCNTSIDLLHGMGEVTNAFITLTNTGNMDLTNLKATLFARDEGGEHPDKTVEIALLPVSQKITIKLTVDSTYNAETLIQIEVIADGGLFQRVDKDSCRDIGVFAPDPVSLNTPVPVNP